MVHHSPVHELDIDRYLAVFAAAGAVVVAAAAAVKVTMVVMEDPPVEPDHNFAVIDNDIDMVDFDPVALEISFENLHHIVGDFDWDLLLLVFGFAAVVVVNPPYVLWVADGWHVFHPTHWIHSHDHPSILHR